MVKGMIGSASDRPSFLIPASELRAGCTQEPNTEDKRQDLLGNKNIHFHLPPLSCGGADTAIRLEKGTHSPTSVKAA